VTLPETMATECQDKCTFAFSWVPTNSGKCEIYMNCADISVAGAKGGNTNPITKNFQTELIDQGSANGYGCQRVDVNTHWTPIFMPLLLDYDESDGSDTGSDSGSDSTPSPTIPVVDPVLPTSIATPSPIPSGNGILITNRAGSGQWWYTVELSDVPSNIAIESVYLRHSASSTWELGEYHQWGDYYSFHETAPFDGPFDFRMVSTSGLEIESLDVVEDYTAGTSGRMTASFDAAFTMEEGSDMSDPVERVITWIVLFGIAWCGVCIAAVLCKRKNRKRASLSAMEKMSTAVDEDHQIAEIEISVIEDDVESEDDTIRTIGSK